MEQHLSHVPPCSDADHHLLKIAAQRLERENHIGMNSSRLEDIAAADGIDLATAMLYLHIRSSARQSTLIRAVESGALSPPLREIPRLIVMPGAFHREHRHTGADGGRVLELAAALGWPAERVNVPSLAPMAANAASLAENLSRRRGEPVIVVSLSKGGADFRAALGRPDALLEMRNVRAWVNISGMITGTPLVQWLTARPVRCLGIRALLRLRGQRFAEVEELRHVSTDSLSIPTWLGAGLRENMRVIHLLGFPLTRHLSNDWARRGHARLAPLGPNDGGGILLHDCTHWPGEVFPIWGTDHYMQPRWDIRPLLLRIFREAAQPTPRLTSSDAASAPHR